MCVYILKLFNHPVETKVVTSWNTFITTLMSRVQISGGENSHLINKACSRCLHLPQIWLKVTLMLRLHHAGCYLHDLEYSFILVSSIWQRNWASTPCGLVTCRPRWVLSSCLGVPCLEGECRCFRIHQANVNKQINGFYCDFFVFLTRFGDLFGARAALSVACASTVVFFLLLAAANHPAMLFIHKVPTLFMHVIPGERLSTLNVKSAEMCACTVEFSIFPSLKTLFIVASQMVVTDLSEPEKRADALSKLGLCFGIGMIAGSTLGGNLNTRYGWISRPYLPPPSVQFCLLKQYFLEYLRLVFPREKFTACVGAAGSFFSLLLVLKFIPENTKPHAPTADASSESHFSYTNNNP